MVPLYYYGWFRLAPTAPKSSIEEVEWSKKNKTWTNHVLAAYVLIHNLSRSMSYAGVRSLSFLRSRVIALSLLLALHL